MKHFSYGLLTSALLWAAALIILDLALGCAAQHSGPAPASIVTTLPPLSVPSATPLPDVSPTPIIVPTPAPQCFNHKGKIVHCEDNDGDD